MALFDSTKVVNLTFSIVLTDPEEVARLRALYPNGVNRAPETGAAIEFGAPWAGFTNPSKLVPPYSYTTWPTSQDKPFPTNVATFTRHTGGIFGMGGTTVRYYWIGEFLLAPEADPVTSGGGTVQATATRRWVEGFEIPGRGLAGISGNYYTTDAARHSGGRGLSIRGLANTYITAALNVYDAAVVSPKSWERFYIRLRKAPSVTIPFWQSVSSAGATTGQVLAITAGGQLAIYQGNGTTLIGVVPDVTLEVWNGHTDHDVWRRIDLLIDMGTTPGTVGTFTVYVDGVARSTLGAVAGTNHSSSRMGAPFNVVSDLELDVDDWMNATLPAALTGLDWKHGSKIALLRNLDYSSSTGWTGDVRLLNQDAIGALPTEVTSSTTVALLATNTDGSMVIDRDAGSIGVVALAVLAWSRRGAASGSLGYKLGAATAVDVSVTQQTSLATNGIIVSAAAGTADALPSVTPIQLRHTKGAGADAAAIASLLGQVEMIGQWSRADYSAAELAEFTADTLPAGDSMGPHNHRYPRTPWAHRGLAPPIAPYVVTAGTYTGNGTGQDLSFRAPVHWLFIRPLTGSTGGAFWMGAMIAAHAAYGAETVPLLHPEEDPTFVGLAGEDAQQASYRVRLAGANTQINAAGVTYQYVAVSDPGMRYFLSTVVQHKSGTLPTVFPLIDPNFVPTFAFIFQENVASLTTRYLYLKSTGLAADAMASFNAFGLYTDALTFGTGQVTTGNGIHGMLASAPIALGLWRRSDGSQDTGEAAAVSFGSYVGDGSASRTIGLSPASGKRPVFVMVVGPSGQGYFRDPSHTTTNSSDAAGTNSTTGITAGAVDAFTVGSALNSNAAVYSYFALLASATACNNGFGCNGEYIPVEPWIPPGGPDGPWPPNPGAPAPEPGGGEEAPGGAFPGGNPADAVDFSSACVAWSTFLTNIALSRIGSSHQIDNIATEVSEEAYKARLVYALTVEAVLRDYAWPFATRYADLTLVSGSEATWANKDWVYAYRAPANMVAARRIVSQELERRGPDPDPPQFRIGSDATGLLIYANAPIQTGIPVQLEYTTRMTCPAQQGDPLFKDALVWKLAAALALPLARDAKKAAECEAMYRDVIVAAKQVAANEDQKDNEQGDAPWIRAR